MVDTLNFSFWTTEGDPSHGYSVRFGGEEYTGYWSLCAAINRALEVRLFNCPLGRFDQDSPVSRSNVNYVTRPNHRRGFR